MIEKRIDAAARRLLAARRSGSYLEGLADGFVPEDHDIAYAIQDALIDAAGEGIGGWKIAAGTAPAPVCSPILASAYRQDNDVLDIAGTMATLIEAEVAVRNGTDLPPRSKDYSQQDVQDAIASLHPSLEILGTRFDPKSAVPQLLVISDLQNNAAVVVGAPRQDWRDLDLSRLAITLMIGGKASRVETGPTVTDVLAALAWLANGRARRYGGLKAGQVIITGSRVNAPVGKPGDRVDADFGSFGHVGVRLA